MRRIRLAALLLLAIASAAGGQTPGQKYRAPIREIQVVRVDSSNVYYLMLKSELTESLVGDTFSMPRTAFTSMWVPVESAVVPAAPIPADSHAVASPRAQTTASIPTQSGKFGAPNIAASTFDNGVLAPFRTATRNNAYINVVPDPTGQLSGRVVRIRFPRESAARSADVNRALSFSHEVGYGESVFIRGDVVVPTPAPHMVNAMRRLIYVQTPSNGPNFCVIKADGNMLKAEISGHRVMRGGDFPFEKRVSLEVEITTNSSPSAADGILRVWKNGELVINSTNVKWLTSGAPFKTFLIGQQTQNKPSDLFNELRYWDNVAISSRRIGY